MSVKRPSLPPLLFGDADSVRHADSRSLGDQIQRTFPGLNAYDPLGNPHHFCAKSYDIALADLKLVASAISPSHVDRDGPQEMTLMLPLIGQCEVTMDGDTFAWGAGRAGVFMPEINGRVVGRGDLRSLLMLQLDRNALERTARAMFGADEDGSTDLRLHEPRLTSLTLAGCNFEAVLRKLGSLIELYRYDSVVLSRLGFDDIFYRHVVGMLCPGEVLSAQEAAQTLKRSQLRVTDRVCDAMRAALGERWTLTDMERISGMSARALQYAFKERFGYSPMEWLREQRLQLARRRLLLHDFNSITQLAMECGFGTASQFASFYKARFGTTPSHT